MKSIQSNTIKSLDSPEILAYQITYVESQIDRLSIMVENGNDHKKYNSKLLQMYICIVSSLLSIQCNDTSSKSLQYRSCKHCDTQFKPKTSKALFCSTRCRVANYRLKNLKAKTDSSSVYLINRVPLET